MVEFDVQAAIEDMIRNRLDTVKIVSVHTVRDEDFDGDDILRVTVVVDSPASDFNVGRVAGLVRHLQPKLDALREHAFPMISFMSQREAEAAAA